MLKDVGEKFYFSNLFSGGRRVILERIGKEVYTGLMQQGISSEVAAFRLNQAGYLGVEEADIRKMRSEFRGGFGKEAYNILMRMAGLTIDECIPMDLLAGDAKEKAKAHDNREYEDLEICLMTWVELEEIV